MSESVSDKGKQCRASGMELVSDVPLRMKHLVLPFLVSGLNEIALVNNFSYIM